MLIGLSLQLLKKLVVDVAVSGENIDNMHTDVGNNVKALGGREKERSLWVASWNFAGLGSERKQKEIGE